MNHQPCLIPSRSPSTTMGWRCSFLTLLLSVVTFSAPAEIVINEIHYAPSNKTRPTEFIELLNSGTTAVDISGWRFADAVQFTFPPETVLEPQGYRVVAASPATFQSTYGFAPLGPWTGRLKKGGARIELRNGAGDLIDEVEYGTGFPWPSAAHGDGSSMELIHPSLDNNLGGSWRSSGSSNFVNSSTTYLSFQDSLWRFRKGTNEASSPTNAWRQLNFAEDDSWLTAQTSIGFGDNDDKTDLSKAPWNLPFGMQSNYISLYLRHPFVVPEGLLPGRLHLRVIIEDGCIIWINGRELGSRLHMRDKLEKPYDAGVTGRPFGATAHKAVSGGKPVIEDLFISAKDANLVVGTNIIAIHAFNSSLTGNGVSIDCEVIGEIADPTPGGPNGAFTALPPPQIRQVSHAPDQPTSGIPVLITAKITDPNAVASVQLQYQIVEPGKYIRKTDPGYTTNWVSLPMTDDGKNGDLVAGDNVYTAQIPPEAQVHRRFIRYRISAADSAGASVRVPYSDDPEPNFAYFVYDGVPGWKGAFNPNDKGAQGVVKEFPASFMGSLPIYHLIANQTDVINSQYEGAFDTIPMWGTLVYHGKVYDHITFNNRGEFSTYVSGKNKWRIHVNNTHEFQAHDNLGRPYAETWDDFNLNGGSSPWIAANRGMCGIEECISFRLYELLGVPSPRTHYISFRVIDNSVEAAEPTANVQDATFPGTGKGQYSGDFWGLYLVIESPDGSFLDERGLPDGSLYKIEGGGNGTGNKKNQGPTHPANNADWDRFAATSGTAAKEPWWRTNLNLSAYYSFRIASRIVGNVDMRNGWNHYFYHHTNDLWMPIPWDLDMMFVARTHQSASGAISQDNSISVPILAIEKRNRAREVLDLMLSDSSPNGGQIGQLVDEYAQIVHPDGASLTWSMADSAMWNFHPRTAGSPTAHTDSNHKGNFYYSPHTFNAAGGAYKRWLKATNFVGFAEFPDFVTYLKNYMTDTFRSPKAWVIGNGDQMGYGYEFVKSEAKETVASDVPSRPTILSVGAEGFPADDLQFLCSEFSGKSFSAVQWRLGWIAAPGIAGYSKGQPRRYEVEPHWTSDEMTTFSNTIQIPAAAVKPGNTYRARVRHKDANGRWSSWSAPVQFVCGPPKALTALQSLVISEIMYHPRQASRAEATLGFTDEDFEYLELLNTSSDPIDLSNVGFTTGVNFQFVSGTRLAGNAFGIVAHNKAAFEQRYGTGRNVLGEFMPGNLKNSGELVTLAFQTNTLIRAVDYRDSAPWPTAADGDGASLQLISPYSRPDHSRPEHWRASSSELGTPGLPDGTTFALWTKANGIADDPTADPDSDDLSNLSEYAFGGDPKVFSKSLQPIADIQSLSTSSGTERFLTLSYRGRTDASDLGYHVELSTDLVQWTESAVLVSVEPGLDGTARYTWRTPTPISSQANLFARVRISLP